ncbi:MAG: GNAT family N-acetyltransferase [Polyangiaceae bacterium]|nr:GNAT family N-acetyltransferase [Polyangiaceae bacterium]
MSVPPSPPPAPPTGAALFARLEAFYDAVPRDRAGVERLGPFAIFVPDGPGLPLYARPQLGSRGATAADVEAVRARQRELDLPEAFEWVHETSPWLLPLVEASGLSVLQAPLLVLEPDALGGRGLPPGVSIRLLDPERPDFAAGVAMFRALAGLAFGSPGTGLGPVGPLERDAALFPLEPAEAERDASRVASLRAAYALAESSTEGALAGGAYQRVGPVTEIVGVATLPSARRRGLGAAVTAALARQALATGAELVFLAAGSEEVARLYASVGFRRVGTACIAATAAG